MSFVVIGAITEVETFAIGTSIRELPRLRKIYGRGRWRKRRGRATIRLPGGTTRAAELHWYEATGIGRKELKIKRYLDRVMTSSRKKLVVCLTNRGYKVSLEPRKIYEALPDADAAEHGQIRVIDESGEDYLYPEELFAEVDPPLSVRRAVLAAV